MGRRNSEDEKGRSRFTGWMIEAIEGIQATEWEVRRAPEGNRRGERLKGKVREWGSWETGRICLTSTEGDKK